MSRIHVLTIAAALAAFTAPAHAGKTLDGIKSRGQLACGVSTGVIGFSAADSQGHRTARAIEWIKDNFAQPLSIDALADAANMSKSSLHHHFKALTAMSPLQYQKQLRLQEARKMMLTEALDAATVARRVGYESPSQFSREYRRLFGAPPLRDIARMR